MNTLPGIYNTLTQIYFKRSLNNFEGHVGKVIMLKNFVLKSLKEANYVYQTQFF